MLCIHEYITVFVKCRCVLNVFYLFIYKSLPCKELTYPVSEQLYEKIILNDLHLFKRHFVSGVLESLPHTFLSTRRKHLNSITEQGICMRKVLDSIPVISGLI